VDTCCGDGGAYSYDGAAFCRDGRKSKRRCAHLPELAAAAVSGLTESRIDYSSKKKIKTRRPWELDVPLSSSSTWRPVTEQDSCVVLMLAASKLSGGAAWRGP
jgi:hypothetical protein